MDQHEKKVLSQLGQDGVLEHIFDTIKTENVPPYFVEFGFNSNKMEGGSGSNTAHLYLHKGWRGLLLDGDFSNPSINLHKEFITSKNICELFEKYKVPKSPDYVSIDIDSCDLWVFRAMLEKYTPRVVTVEYNGHFPIDSAVTFPDDPKETWQLDRIYGASLKALRMVGEEFGYKLVHVVSMLDAFFVRGDLWEKDAPPLETFADKSGRYFGHPPCVSGRENIMIDYGVWRETKDVEKAREAAKKHTYLLTQHP